MVGPHPILAAFMAGFACACFLSALPGPINLTILNQGAQRGFQWGLLIGLGAAVMDVIYCSISFTGIAPIINHGPAQMVMRILSVLFLLWLGARFLSVHIVAPPVRMENSLEQIAVRAEQNLPSRSAFVLGFGLVAGNLGVLAAWVMLSAMLMSTPAFSGRVNWVTDNLVSKLVCVTGVLLAKLLWSVIWSFLVSRWHGRITISSLLRLQRASGLCLIAAALYEGYGILRG